MNNNYPVKYAIMPMYGRNIMDLSQEEVVANVVSKCYVIGTMTSFLVDGLSHSAYKVVFPFNEDNMQAINPEFAEGRCINYSLVGTLFDTFEEAKEVAERLDQDLLSTKMTSLPVDENFEATLSRIYSAYAKAQIKYQEMEQYIRKATEDMNITDAQAINKKYPNLMGGLSLEEKSFIDNAFATDGPLVIDENDEPSMGTR